MSCLQKCQEEPAVVQTPSRSSGLGKLSPVILTPSAVRSGYKRFANPGDIPVPPAEGAPCPGTGTGADRCRSARGTPSPAPQPAPRPGGSALPAGSAPGAAAAWAAAAAPHPRQALAPVPGSLQDSGTKRSRSLWAVKAGILTRFPSKAVTFCISLNAFSLLFSCLAARLTLLGCGDEGEET